MKTAYGVQLVRKERKSSDPADLLYDVFIRRVQFYRGDNDFVKEERLARPMTEEMAKALVAQLQGRADEVNVVELYVDDEQYLAESLDDLRPKNESLSIKDLKQTVESCLKSGMNPNKVTEIVSEELLGAARLREALRECVKENISHGRILEVAGVKSI